MKRFRLKRVCAFLAFLPAMLTALVSLHGCAGRSSLSGAEAPPDYERHITLVLERGYFQAVAGAEIAIEAAPPTRLIEPPDGLGRTDANGNLELVLKPLPHYQAGVWSGGDIVADFPVQLKLTVLQPDGEPLEYFVDDLESFARYRDPLYQGLNRDPEADVTYYVINIP
ncbi:MAG: hypothetical protein LBS31_13445 [Candidatus Adiutrix sp.]|jgi:hypothetical protein|nr:hypothetical protein [Candidatus Adiutrix sp.]